MRHILLIAIFMLLSGSIFLLLDINPIRKKTKITLSKKAADDKRKRIDEKYVKLKFSDKILLSVKNTASMSGININTFWVTVIFSGFLGIVLGKALFCDTLLSTVTGIAMLPMPYIIFKVRARWYKRNQDELLENSMNLITNSYLSCNDIIKAVNDNLDKLDLPKPFAEFVTDVTLIDSNIKRALLKLDFKINNKYFSEWTDILILAQEKSGDYRFILPSVVQSMNDAKRLQIEADTVMMQVWRDYFTSIILAFSVIPLLRWSNSAWFDILTNTAAGKLIIVLMIIMTLISAFLTLKINKPL